MSKTQLKLGIIGALIIAFIALLGGLLTDPTVFAQPGNLGETGAKPPPKNPERVQQDIKEIQGTWKLVFAQYEGRQLPAEEIAKLTLVMSGEKCTLFKAEDKIHEHGDFKLDPTKKPKAIDISEDQGPLKGQSNRGIYLLEDDLFIVCYNHPHMERPTEFTSRPNSTVYLFIYKRDKP